MVTLSLDNVFNYAPFFFDVTPNEGPLLKQRISVKFLNPTKFYNSTIIVQYDEIQKTD